MNAPDKAIEIKAAVTAIIAFLTALWGWLGWAIVILVTCMALDYVTGSLAAARHGEWSSAKAREGLWHKLGEVFAVLVAALADIAVDVIIKNLGIGIDILPAIITPVVVLWYVFTELGSMVENAVKLGAPVPSWLIKILKLYKDKIDAEQAIPEEKNEGQAV